jgi:hypothetical protein
MAYFMLDQIWLYKDAKHAAENVNAGKNNSDTGFGSN